MSIFFQPQAFYSYKNRNAKNHSVLTKLVKLQKKKVTIRIMCALNCPARSDIIYLIGATRTKRADGLIRESERDYEEDN